MTADHRARADQNLSHAAEQLGLADPRPPYRERLRVLKEEEPEAFGRALRHYEDIVLPELASEGLSPGDAMAAWVRYGESLGTLTAPGRVVTIDGDGRALPFTSLVEEGNLILHIPADTAVPVLVAVAPARPSAAQQATLDLLVNRKLSLPTP